MMAPFQTVDQTYISGTSFDQIVCLMTNRR